MHLVRIASFQDASGRADLGDSSTALVDDKPITIYLPCARSAPAPAPDVEYGVSGGVDEFASLPTISRGRGSEGEKMSFDKEELDEETMKNVDRSLAAEAEWKSIQKNTFTRWANMHLSQANMQMDDLQVDLSDGLKLIALLEVLSGKRMPKHNKKTIIHALKVENVTIALKFLEAEGVTLINIDSIDIVDCNLKLILGLIWTLILHYAISMPMLEGSRHEEGNTVEQMSPKEKLRDWILNKIPDLLLGDLTKDFQDGKAVGALVNAVAPGLCPDWEEWDPQRPVENATEAMDLADKWLNVPKILAPEDLVDPNVDEESMLTYLSQFTHAKLKFNAPLREKTNIHEVGEAQN